jgi:uncharacterized DUF497 family protein
MPESRDTYSAGFEWDERKRQTNLAKHGIDFARAARVFEGRVVEWNDLRREYGERRRLVLGLAGHTVLFVVYTWRAGHRRLISARKASADERKAYYAGAPSRPR